MLALPLAALALLLAAPDADVHWQHHPAHFWLVLLTAGLNAVLAYATGVAARRREDRRVHVVSLSFLAASGFLALHALATPGVLLDASNLGFVIATPIGLVLAGGLAALSSLDRDLVHPRAIERGLLVLLAAWAVMSLTLLPEVDDSVVPKRLSAPLVALSVAGIALYAYAVLRYAALWRERRSRLVLGFAVAFVLLAEAMVAVALGRNWQASWWEWHVLMLLGFVVIAAMAHLEGPEERWGRLYRPQQARVTVLFADLEGFTTWSERHDAAEVSTMLDAQFASVIPAVERHGGRVDRLVGDAIFAVFSGGSCEEKAAQAALDLQRESAAARSGRPSWPQFRVGLHVGDASMGVLGTGSGQTFSAVGDTVNLGARIESLAPAGGVAITRDVADAIEGAATKPLGTVQVKGREEPVEVLLLTGLLV